MSTGPAFANDHNVYILGAGFSAASGIPLIRDFLSKMRSAVGWLESQGRHVEADNIKTALQFRLRAASASHRVSIDPDNIEELFCLASATETDAALTNSMTIAIAATIDYAAKNPPRTSWQTKDVSLAASFEPPPGWKATDKATSNRDMKVFCAPLYDLIVGALVGVLTHRTSDSRDTFITFNYDTLVEEALSNLGRPFNYGLGANVEYAATATCERTESPSADSVPVYKIHGSMNWAVVKDRSNQQSDGVRLKVYRRYDGQNEDKSPPLLIPPTWRKVFRPELGKVWDGAIRALTVATRVIVIGFSLPPADVHFKYLLAAGLQSNISLKELTFVNPTFHRYSNSNQDRDANKLRERIQNVLRPELIERGVVRFEPGEAESIVQGSMSNWTGRERRQDISY